MGGRNKPENYVRFADRRHRRLVPAEPLSTPVRKANYTTTSDGAAYEYDTFGVFRVRGTRDLTGPQRRRITHKANHHKAVLRNRKNAARRAETARRKRATKED